jgi:hypothetical protein
MGIYITTYGIKLEEINSVINSKDNAKFEFICTKLKEHFNAIKPFETGITVEELLHDIVFGNFEKLKADVPSNTAMFVFCYLYKKELPHWTEIKLDIETDPINKRLKEDFKIKDFDITSLIAANPGILPMPDIFTDFDGDYYECPAIGFLTRKNIIWLKRKLSKSKLNRTEIDKMIASGDKEIKSKGFDYQNIQDLTENAVYCIENNLEMLTICG